MSLATETAFEFSNRVKCKFSVS